MTATTQRLFWSDPALLEFEASIVCAERRGDLWAVALDSTAFFPAAGGQPSDRGSLGPGRVVDVLEEGEEIVHLVDGIDAVPTGRVACRVDVERRADIACQHTAQHVVSALAVQLFCARTVGFHLGERVTTVDFEGGGLDAPKLRALERAANAVVRDGRAVRVAFEGGRARRVGLEMVAGEGELRIVSVEGLGDSACCGAHVDATSRIGAIRLGRIEKVRGATRVELFAGDRVLAEAERLYGLLAALSAKSGAGVDELPTWADAALAETKALKREAAELSERCAALEADVLVANAEAVFGARLVARVVCERDARALKALAAATRKAAGTIAILGAAHEDKAALVVARSAELALDVRPVLKGAAELLGAKGGGTADLAQCGGGDPAKLEAAVDAAGRLVRAALIGERNAP
jgi:alanyl-tRNA synthetase